MFKSHKEAVRASFNNFIQVNTQITKHFKSANPALLLGYFISEEKFIQDKGRLDAKGYFYCTVEKIEEKFGLSKKVQDSSIMKLEDAKLIEVHVKSIEGSKSISQCRHIKILHTNIYNLIHDITPTPKPETLPPMLIPIKKVLLSICKQKKCTWVPTGEDEHILTIGSMLGVFEGDERLNLGHKRLKHKRVTFKYLLTAFGVDFSKFPTKKEYEDKRKAESKSSLSQLDIAV